MHSRVRESYLSRIFGKSVRWPLHAHRVHSFATRRSSTFSGRARAFIEQGRACLCTHSNRGCRGCEQRDALCLARLRPLHCLLPCERATRAVVQQVLALCRIGEARNDVINGERELRIGVEAGVRFEAHAMVRAPYAVTDSAPACAGVCNITRYEPSNSNLPKRVSTPFLN